jgi:prophage regulatory protein
VKFLGYEDLRSYGIRWSRVHIDRLQKAGRFPTKIKIGANTAAYLESEIVAWLEARCAERGGPAPSKPIQQGVAA